MKKGTFTRSLFTAAYTGTNEFLTAPAPTAVLLDSFTAPTALLLHGLTLSSAMVYQSQSVNGIWVVWNQSAPALFMGGPIPCLASHIYVAESGTVTQLYFSRSTWVRFPDLYLAPQTKISLYGNGVNNFGATTRVTATCELQLSELA